MTHQNFLLVHSAVSYGIKVYQCWWQSGKIVDITTECSVYEAASLLKEYILHLPESLVPEDTFQGWADVLKMEVTASYASYVTLASMYITLRCFGQIEQYRWV